MREILQNLVDLQYIDSRLDELKRLRGDLPEDIMDMETDISRLEARVKKIKTEQTELKLETANLNMEINDAEALIKKYEEQQLSVRNNREYDALTKEMESQKQTIENARSRLEEILLLEEEYEKNLSESETSLIQKQGELETMKANLDDVINKTEEEEKELLEKREEASSMLNQRYLKSYDRLRQGLNNGLAVCPMERGACMGMMMTPQVQMEVKRMNKIVIDENSGRIVVDPSFFEAAREKYA
jgi:uncharacterized protein